MVVSLLAALTVVASIAVLVPSAQAIVLQQNGHWCGFDSPQPLSYYDARNLPEALPSAYAGNCAYAQTHFLGHNVSAHAIRFNIVDRKFLKDMYVGDEKWIGSADIGRSPHFRASENGHSVDGDFVRDFFATGTITLDGQSDHFYAFWVSA
jgi:hypothetical protein